MSQYVHTRQFLPGDPPADFTSGKLKPRVKDTPAENVIELYKYAKEYGTYPLKGAEK